MDETKVSRELVLPFLFCSHHLDGLILASESAGNGESKVYSQRRMEFLENVNGTFHYDGQKLNNISVSEILGV